MHSAASRHRARGSADHPDAGDPLGTGHINWVLAGEFALGQVPGSAAGGQFAHHVQVRCPVIRRAFGLFLVAFGLFFVIYRIVAH